MISIRSAVAAFAAASSLLLVGCATAPQMPISMAPTALSTQGSRIGVAMASLPKADTHLPGASCLLCLAAASLANSSLTTHAKTLSADDLVTLKDSVAEAVRKKGANAVVIAEELKLDKLPDSGRKEPNIARKDFSSLQSAHQLDKLIVLEFTTLGFERTYSAYIPTSDPKGVLRGTAYMVDLKTQTLDWYKPVNVVRGSAGAWDESPKFPGLTNAYYQVIELGKDELLASFKP